MFLVPTWDTEPGSILLIDLPDIRVPTWYTEAGASPLINLQVLVFLAGIQSLGPAL